MWLPSNITRNEKQCVNIVSLEVFPTSHNWFCSATFENSNPSTL